MLTLEQLHHDQQLQAMLAISDRQLDTMGYTDHGRRHRAIVCQRIADILTHSGADDTTIALGIIAGYMHDIGCAVARSQHAQSGAILAYPLLIDRGLQPSHAILVSNAIANHDESTGHPATDISAALILADKSDVHRSRVRTTKLDTQHQLIDVEDIHDRVNYSVVHSRLDVCSDKVAFCLTLDKQVASVSDYFEIFLGRMKMCRTAASVLGMTFQLVINDQVLS